MGGRKLNNVSYISIGSNLGDKVKNCLEAIERVSIKAEIELICRSSFYRTEPWGYEDQDWFVNVVIGIKTSLNPEGLLHHLKDVERQLQKKKEELWGPRNIDLDILFFNNEIHEKPGLILPHPLLHLRRFVLVPLAEICPDFVHPRLNLSVRELLKRSLDKKKVVPL